MNNSSENSSDKLVDIADTVTIGREPEQVTFSVNDVVNSFEELERKFKQYEVKKAVQLWRKDLKTIEAASKRIDRYLDERIKYYELKNLLLYSWRKEVSGKRRRKESHSISRE